MGDQRLKSRKKARPLPKHRKEIEKVRKLIRGSFVKLTLPDYQVSVRSRLRWEADDCIDINWEETYIKILPDAEPLAHRLLGLGGRGTFLRDALEAEVTKALRKTEKFRLLDAEVKRICREADVREKKEENFIWHRDILQWAEKPRDARVRSHRAEKR